jgi:hypothetical protein
MACPEGSGLTFDPAVKLCYNLPVRERPAAGRRPS